MRQRQFANPRQLRSTFHIVLGGVGYAFAHWLFLIVLARESGSVLVGTYGLAQAILAPVILFSFMGTRGIIATRAAGYPGVTQEVWIQARLGALTIVAAFGVGVAYYVSTTIPHTAAALSLGIAVLTVKIAEGFLDLRYAFHLQAGRGHLVGRDQLVRAAGMIPAVAAAYLLPGLPGLGLVIVSVTWIAWSWPRALGLPNPRFAARSLAKAFKRAWPLGINALAIAMLPSLPKYAVELGIDREALGIYVGLSYFVTLLGLVGNAYAQTLTPHLRVSRGRPNEATIARVIAMAHLHMALLAGTAALISWRINLDIAALVYGPQFAGVESVLTLMLVGALFSACTPTLGYTLTANGVKLGQVAIQLGGIAAMIGLAVVQWNEFSLLNAALVLTGGLAVQWALSLIAVTIVLGRRS